MIQAYTVYDCGDVIKISEGDRVVFKEKKIQTGTTATLCSEGEVVHLNKAGFYEVTVGVTVSGGTADPNIAMYIDGKRDNSSVGYGIDGNGNPKGVMTFTTLVRVQPTCCPCKQAKELTFLYEGDTATLIHSNIVITKLC